MKKTLLVLPLVLLVIAGCSKTPTGPSDNADNEAAYLDNYFVDTNLGIQFAYQDAVFDDISKAKAKVSSIDNTIVYDNPDLEKPLSISVFTKKEDQSIENAILDLLTQQGKDASDCVIVNRWDRWANTDYGSYIIDFANPDISYTQSEQDAIDAAANGEWGSDMKRKEIYNQKLAESCSLYADPMNLWTSKGYASEFVYNRKQSFVFLAGSNEKPFYRPETLSFLQ